MRSPQLGAGRLSAELRRAAPAHSHRKLGITSPDLGGTSTMGSRDLS